MADIALLINSYLNNAYENRMTLVKQNFAEHVKIFTRFPKTYFLHKFATGLLQNSADTASLPAYISQGLFCDPLTGLNHFESDTQNKLIDEKM